MSGVTGPSFIAVFCAVLLVVSLVPVGLLEPARADKEISGPQPAFMITNDSADPLRSFEAFDAVTFAAFDFNGDGVKNIVAHNDNNNLYVFDGKTGDLVGELVTEHPRGWEARELAGPSVGDINGNGVMDIVVTNSAGWVTAFEVRPGEDPDDGVEFERLWETWMDPRVQDADYIRKYPWAEFDGHPGLDGSAYLADAKGDNRDEIFLQLDDMPGLYELNGDGEVTWWVHWSEGNSNPTVADFTGDGRLEVMYPSDGGRIMIFDARHNNSLCNIDVKDLGPHPASISTSPTVVDLTGDGAKEIVFGVRNAVEDKDDPEWYLKQNAHFFAITAECEVLWQKTWDWANPHVHMHPVPADVTGNGQLDIIFQDWNTVGHSPGDWQQTGNSNLFAVDGRTGELIWQRETQSYWSNKNVALADVTGDGEEEILVVEPRGGQDGIMLYSLDGNRKSFIPGPAGWDVSRGPGVLDLNGDGRLEIVLPVHRKATGCDRQLDVGCREGALQIYRTPGSGEPSWSNVKVYNHRFDQLGAPLSIAGPDVEITEREADPGRFALQVSGHTPQTLHVLVPGTSQWQRLDHDGDGRFESGLSYFPAPGDDVRVRVYFSDARVGLYEHTAQSGTPMLEVVLVDREGDPVRGANLKVAQGNGTIWEGDATSDGKIRIPVEAGSTNVEASASGHRDASKSVDVADDGVTTMTLEMPPSLIGFWLSLIGLLALTGLVVGGVVFKKRRNGGP